MDKRFEMVCTHGFIKKNSKTPKHEIRKAIQIRTKYIEYKQLNNRQR
ncbi:MAG: type II toxin-antitoxin system RelE/ParE family toxin [Tannerella sp.]|nr:type II toxin-antitoxin system RelE/ParE family toxin [Tannerella sp.]